jgi:hypothetical protein
VNLCSMSVRVSNVGGVQGRTALGGSPDATAIKNKGSLAKRLGSWAADFSRSSTVHRCSGLLRKVLDQNPVRGAGRKGHMRTTLWFLSILLVAVDLPARGQSPAAGLDAYSETVKAAGDAFDNYVVLQKLHAEERKAARIQLVEDRKNALASVVMNLRALASLKADMAKQLGCLGQNQPSTERFSHCWNTFQFENAQLREDLGHLKATMDLADPNWSVEHGREAQAINDVYYEKMGISGDVVIFAGSSQSGRILRNISINLADSQKLAAELEKEVAKLTEVADTLSRLLQNA